MNTNYTAETFLERLGNSTAGLHQQLEELPVSVSIMNPEVTTGEYAHYLSLMHDVIKDTEEHIFPLLQGIIDDIELRKKNHCLTADLDALHFSTSPAGIRPFSGRKGAFTPAFALGIMYVTEGSSLGGRVILKNIKAALGIDEASGASFFTGYGQQTGSYWKKFLESLVKYEAENNCGTEIIEGANFAFSAIALHFNNMHQVIYED